MSSEPEVLFADNHLLVVRKPAGLPCVPDSSGDESLFEQSKAWVKREGNKSGAVYLGIVQRLDRPVSGVVCFARTSKAAARLTRLFGQRAAHKRYWAVGAGLLPAGAPRSGELSQWLRKDPLKRRVARFERDPGDAKLALTRWREVEVHAAGNPPCTLFSFEPLTGRSHQLRLAACSLGCPLLGDLKYAPSLEPLADRSIALHAAELAFEHPVRRTPMRFSCPPPARPWWRGWQALEQQRDC